MCEISRVKDKACFEIIKLYRLDSILPSDLQPVDCSVQQKI
jgi:hypothetical protein